MKKIISFFLALVLLCGILTSCGNINIHNLKIGMIVYSDENDPYVSSHIDALKKVACDFKINRDKVIFKTNVTPDGCYGAINELLEEKCNLIFSVGDGFEDYMVQSATENEKVQYCVCNGVQAATADMLNLHSYSTREFESRYVAGIAAGLKMNDLIEGGEITPESAVIGYVGSVKGASNTSAYSAFYLGAKSVCEEVKMKVLFSGAKQDKELERKVAGALIANGCILVAQQSFANGAAEICENNRKLFVGCISSVTDIAPEYSVTSVLFDWFETYKYPVEQIINDKKIETEWSKGAADTTGFITELNDSAFAEEDMLTKAKEELKNAENDLIDGNRHVFDISTFTVNGEKLKSTVSDSVSPPFDNDSQGTISDIEYITEAGYYMENELSALPKFDYQIDGIEVLN